MQLLGIESDKAPEDIAHPDFRWVVPDGTVIKIDQVRALNAFAVQTRSKWQIVRLRRFSMRICST